MSKFDQLYRKYDSELNIQLDEAVVPQQTNQAPAAAAEAGAQPGAGVQPQVPAPQEVKEPQADVTSEGKKFLVQLAVQALGVDPDNLSATDKDIFTTEVTVQNADEMLKRLQSIVDLYG